MLVFIMMAVGLNIVVGYAGLLDLGYVAFYAMGAYTAAWLASHAVRRREVPEGRLRHRQLSRRDRPRGQLQLRRRRRHARHRRDPRLHLGDPRRGRPVDGADRRGDRPADAETARRLPGDRHARLRRDPPPDRPQRERPRRLQPDGRAAGDHAGRLARLRQPPVGLDRRIPARELPDQPEQRARLLLDRARCCSPSPSSARSACATRGSGAPGSPSARTRSPPRPWASR